MTQIRLSSAMRTDTGRVRDHNEDSVLEREDRHLWCVADGMGGHSHGDWASAQVVSDLTASALTGEFDEDVRLVAGAIHEANARIHAHGQANGASSGSTAVALLVGAGRFAVVWVGDSRAYLVRQDTIYRLSTDHSQVQALVDSGNLDASEARSHPMSHVLTRAIGAAPTVEVDVVVDAVAPGDVFMLCSDGLTGLVEDEEIRTILAGNPSQVACDMLVDLANERGGTDNVSVIVVACDDMAPAMQVAP